MLISQYKMSSNSSRDIRAQHRLPEEAANVTCTDMAPCSTNYTSLHHIRMSEKDNIKLRKPVVEKLRRDRINSCIEQLKVILEKEFHKQEPNSKLEKADILEMTVSFLRQQLQLQPGLCHGDYNQGFSHCWRDSLLFLSAGSEVTEVSATPLQDLQQQAKQLQQDQRAGITLRPTVLHNRSSSSSSSGPVWRPW